MTGLERELAVHVFQHALGGALHQRQIVIVEQCDIAFVQILGDFTQRALHGLYTLTVDQHEGGRLITNEGNRQYERTPIAV